MTDPIVPTAAIRRLGGIHAATICPLREHFDIDEAALAGHVATVAAVPGIAGLLINGHAGENFVLDPAEKARVVEVVRAAVGPDVFLTSGVNAESSLQAARDAAVAEEAGADAVLVFPPNAWALGQTREGVRLHHDAVTSACGLPVVLYQAPVGAGALPYPVETLLELVASPCVAGIKEGSWEVAAYEQNRRAVRALRPDIAVLGSGDEHLLACYLVGSEGSQVSLAAVVPEMVAALWGAAEEGDWSRARAWHEALYPLAAAIYREPPGAHATARLKCCLRLLGRLADDRVRPPVPALSVTEQRRLRAALDHADHAARTIETAARPGASRVSYTFQFGQIAPYLGPLAAGAWLSLQIAAIAFAAGFLIGLVCASLLQYGAPFVQRLVRAYVVFFLNTPLLVQVFFIYFAMPDFGIVLSSFAAVAIGMSLNAGAYMTEIQRAGFASIRRSEIDAAEAMGFSRLQIIRYVVLPHIVKVLYPALSNQYIILTMTTSIAAIFGVEELTGRAYNINAQTFRSLEIFSVVAAYYVALTFAASAALYALGRYAFRVRRRAAL